MMQFGQIVLGHEVIDLIAEGGQFSVAKARCLKTGAVVAIKQLAAAPGQANYDEELARFHRQAGLRFGHPNILDPIDSSQEDGERYITTPFVAGNSLASHVTAAGGRLPHDQARRIILEIASGLSAVHARGVVHRDIKPENVQVRPDGSAVLLDFGICRKVTEKTITRGAGLLGSPAFMSPEQTLNPSTADHRSDLYSLGAVDYFMLTGFPPVRGNDVDAITRSVREDIPASPRTLDPSIPADLDSVCMTLLAKPPEHRLQTADQVIAALSGQVRSSARQFCRSCGRQAVPGARYCGACGAALGLAAQGPRCMACGTTVGEAASCSHCRRPFSPTSHRLSGRQGTMAGDVVRIPEGIFVVGRIELSSRDAHISRRHLLVACTDGVVHFQDSGSSNGTFVAGVRADTPIMLAPGQEVIIGGNVVVYTRT
ncbi:MAG: FHA domain-containing serine/threonine-protein kinase [Phycisphaerae bacterium]